VLISLHGTLCTRRDNPDLAQALKALPSPTILLMILSVAVVIVYGVKDFGAVAFTY